MSKKILTLDIICQHSVCKCSIHFCGREGTITHISVGLIHKNLTDFLHSAPRAEAGRAQSSDTPWRAEAGVRRGWVTLWTVSVNFSRREHAASQWRRRHTTVTHCTHSQGVKSASQFILNPPLTCSRPWHFPAQYYREWRECFCSGSQCRPPASHQPPVAGHEVRAEARPRGGAPCHWAQTRGARGVETSPDKPRAGVRADKDGRRELALSVCDFQNSKPLLFYHRKIILSFIELQKVWNKE